MKTHLKSQYVPIISVPTWLQIIIIIIILPKLDFQLCPNIIKQCVFVHVDPENITMGCPNLVQGDSDEARMCIGLGNPMVRFSKPT